MSKNTLFKLLIPGVIIVGLVFGGIYMNKTKNNENINENNVSEDITYNDMYNDNYDYVEDVDLNNEFENAVNEDNNDESSSNTEDATIDDSTEEEDGSVKEEDSSIKNESSSSTTNNATGVFQGFADSNFVEIKVGNDYATYRVSSEAKKSLSNKEFGDNITFEFKEENGQLIITSVK